VAVLDAAGVAKAHVWVQTWIEDFLSLALPA